MSRDHLHRFLIDESNVRGEIVQLTESWQAMLEPADYPEDVIQVLGEAVAATSLLAETIKFDGALTFQVQGNGGISLLVVQVTAENTFRGMARWSETRNHDSLATLFGQAQMVVTVEMGEGKQDYQGIVPVVGTRLQDALASYFEQSEQLPTRLWLASHDQAVAGLLLQKLPGEERDDDLWNRLNQFADTVKTDELLELEAQEVLYRLFHEEQIRVFDGEALQFKCTCSKSKIGSALISLGQEDANQLLEEQGEISIDCQFCQRHYQLDKVDVAAIFSSAQVSDGTAH